MDRIIKKINDAKLKSYKKQLKSEVFKVDNELNFSETGEVMLDCQIGKLERIFSPFDIAKDRTIDESFSAYLLQETDIVPIRYNIAINLHVENSITEEHAKQIEKAIKRYYSFKITAANVKIRKNLISSIILYLLGIGCLTINILSEKLSAVLPIYETSLIASWFLLWEATGLLFFDRSKLKLQRFNMLRIFNAKLIIEKDNDENLKP
ncbi:MAG: hypothetical protein PHO33_02225 [Clostridia bacterium]|nr:hypothetical protein [Clostridia bacterium]